jgi:hypothetical protein
MATMLSTFPARFNALAASLNASYQSARLHFKGDYSPLSQNCTQQGRSLVLLNNHLTTLGSLEGIQDLLHFKIPERITNISDEYRATFLLSNNARDEVLSTPNEDEDSTSSNSLDGSCLMCNVTRDLTTASSPSQPTQSIIRYSLPTPKPKL